MKLSQLAIPIAAYLNKKVVFAYIHIGLKGHYCLDCDDIWAMKKENCWQGDGISN